MKYIFSIITLLSCFSYMAKAECIQCDCKVKNMEEVYRFLDTMPQLQIEHLNFDRYVLDTLSQFKGDLSLYSFQIEMMVNLKGKPCNVKINNKADSELYKEEKMIKKRIENMPYWKPGIKNGIPVNVIIRRKIYLNVE